MDMIKIGILALPLALSIGCSSSQESAPKPPQPTVFDPLTRQEQRARDVQNTIDQGALRERRAVDAQERGDAPPNP